MQDIIRLAIAYLTGIWRYRWLIVIVPALVSPVGWSFVATLPDQFEASAKVFVDTDSVLNPLMRGIAIRVDDRRRVDMMTKLLFGRQVLEKLARMTDQDLKVQTAQEMDDLIQDLKGRVKLKRDRGNIYKLGFRDESRDLAKRVVQSFLTIFVETNLGESRKDQDSAEQFLLREIKEYERRLTDSERKLKEFKTRNLAYVSDQGGYFEDLQNIKTKLESFRLEYQIAQERSNELGAQLAQLEEEGVEYEANIMDVGIEQLNPLQARINEMTLQMEELLLRYTPRHPEVAALKRTIQRLQSTADEKANSAADEDTSGEEQGENYGQAAMINNPVYQQMKLLLAEAEAEVASRQAIVREYERRLEHLQLEVDRVLEIEAEQKQLNRDYGIMRSKHGKLMESLESLRLGRQIDSSAETVRFRVIEPPQVPESPAGPNRILLSSIVFAGSLLVGFGLAFVTSLFKPAFSDRKHLSEAIGVRVLGSVDMIWTDQQMHRKRLMNAAYALSLLALFISYGLVLVIYRLDIDILSRLPGI